MFLFCEYGQICCNGFEEIDEMIYQTDWYTLPLDLQKFWPIVINNTQQPVIITGYANVEYTRETFDSVSAWI